MEAFAKAAEEGLITDTQAHDLIALFQQKIADHRDYVIKNGEDIEEITNWSWEQR
jgi:phosphoketolase